MPNHLVIPDPHASPDEPNDRFEWLGKFIMEAQPDTIVCLGDFADMGSLSSYDRGKRSFEGRRVILDVEAVQDAQTKLFAPLREYNAKRKVFKEKQYKPRMVMITGNHEDRIDRATNDSPELEGFITTELLGYEENGWEVHPFKTPVVIDGIAYCHYFPSGVMGRPIGGKNPARSLLLQNHMSSTAGHSHLLDFAIEVQTDGQKIMACSAGCYTEASPGYAKGTDKFWWRGVIHKKNIVNGVYDFETISINQLRKAYA